MFAFLLTLLILDALAPVGGRPAPGRPGRRAGLARGRHDRYGARRPPGGHLLTKATWWCGGIFLVLALALSLVPRGGATPSGLQERLRATPDRAGTSAPLPIGGARPRPVRRRRRAPAPGATPSPSAAPPAATKPPAPGTEPLARPAKPSGPRPRSPPLQPSQRSDDDRARGDRMTDRPAFVLLEDGAWFPEPCRPIDPAFGEVVFTTNLSGYQETFTDPELSRPDRRDDGADDRQLRRQCRRHGVGAAAGDRRRGARAVAAPLQLARRPRSFDDWLAEAGVPVLEGVDTRRLTRHLRERGAMRGVVAEGRAAQPRARRARLLASPSMEGLDLASRATVREPYTEGAGSARRGVRLRDEAQHRADAGRAPVAG